MDLDRETADAIAAFRKVARLERQQEQAERELIRKVAALSGEQLERYIRLTEAGIVR
jgi:hypothetical protein